MPKHAVFVLTYCWISLACMLYICIIRTYILYVYIYGQFHHVPVCGRLADILYKLSLSLLSIVAHYGLSQLK